MSRDGWTLSTFSCVIQEVVRNAIFRGAFRVCVGFV